MQASLERLKARRAERGDEGGFTLIELLIVIVILAILAAIVVFAVQNLTASSAKAACESDVQTVDHAIQAYVAQVGTQPATIADLMSNTKTGSNGDPVGPWLHNVPTNGTHYSVMVDASAASSVAAVVVPGAATPALGGNTTTTDYSPNGTASAGSGTAPAVATTTSGACTLVKA